LPKLTADVNQSLGLNSGIAIFNPIPVKHAIPLKEMEVVIEEAVRECNNLGITGKDVTPFLLRRVVDVTKGRSLAANIGLIENNARVGAEIAVALSSFDKISLSQPPILESRYPPDTSEDSPTDVMIIGSMAVDLTCTLPFVSSQTMQLHTSHLAKMHTSAGGVAHNVALATCYASSKSVRLITALGSDPEGVWLREYVEHAGLDVRLISGEDETPRYVAIHDKSGELVIAAADMGTIERLKEQDIQREIRRGKPKFLAFDGNITPTSVKAILEECGRETKGIPN
jgi:pseudouridylate synthase / pseudouridine kinase